MENLAQYLNEWSAKIHQQNVEMGWWPEENTRDMNESLLAAEKIMLIITEIAEATEGLRKNLMDDKLPHRKMVEVEMADALIRTLDYMGRYGRTCNFTQKEIDQLVQVVQSTGNDRESTHHLALVTQAVSIQENDDAAEGLVGAILSYSQLFGYDVLGAMEEKVAYNKVRSDHQLENRQKEGGKKF